MTEEMFTRIYRAQSKSLTARLSRRNARHCDDGAQFAFMKLLEQPDDKICEATAHNWLFVVGWRHMLWLIGRDDRIAFDIDPAGVTHLIEDRDLDQLIDDRICLARLDRRERGTLVAQAAGFTAVETAARTTMSTRTVQKMIVRGRGKVRLAATA